MQPKPLLLGLLAFGLALFTPPVGAPEQGPEGHVDEDCFGVWYEAAGAGPLGTHWELFMGSQRIDEDHGPTYADSGPGQWMRALRLYANGELVDEYDGPWCI